MPVYNYVKKPVVIQAIQYTGDDVSADEVIAFSGDIFSNNIDGLYISTMEDKLHISVGDYIIKGVRGEVYVCPQDYFEKTYSFYSPV